MQLSIQNLEMTYANGKRALNGVSVEIDSSAMIGLLGPNGAGKSTFIKLITNGLLPTEGTILLNGQPLEKKEQELKSKLGYLPQSFGLYDELSVRQFLDYICALKGIKDSTKAIDEVLDMTNLTDMGKKRIETLSGGQRQRVGIAQALLGSPQLLILDEPTVGLDPEERVHFRNLFSSLAKDKIVILSTHIIEDVQSICNRLLVVHSGEIIYDGTPSQLIAAAKNHVGTIHKQEKAAGSYVIISSLDTADGVVSRIVAERLPPFAAPAEPTLEDAYMYLAARKESRI